MERKKPFWEKREEILKSLISRRRRTKPFSAKNVRLTRAISYLIERRPYVMVERVNLMSGKTYMEKAGTPGYLSPASEAYWNM